MQVEPLITYKKEHLSFFNDILKKRRESYCQLLEDEEKNAKFFWDVVVITAIDDLQKAYYEQQIEQKLRRKEIPAKVKYHVIPDPKGAKIGCGGATLYVVDFLEKTYGEKLDDLRVFLIHAGGYSKRLANHTISGKIFCPVPFFLNPGSPSITMLEMKFILFIEFPKKMKGGVYLTCADDIELLESEGADFTKPGVTALAHPAPVSIGTTHGVFLLPKDEAKKLVSDGVVRVPNPVTCIRYLHKPTVEAMQEAGCIVDSSDGPQVFVDSNFYFDRSVFKILLQYFRNTEIDCEVDAYGDFLQPMGTNPVDSYFTSTRTTGSNVNVQLQTKRKELYELLHKVPIHVIPFVPSLFIHIGTSTEYIQHLSTNLPKFGFQRWVYSEVVHNGNSAVSLISPKSSIQYSILGDNVTVGDHSVVEYCKILNDKPVTVGEGSILSQFYAPPNISYVPGGVLMHTMVLNNTDTSHSFVTISFGIEDDLKASFNDKKSVKLKGVPLHEAISHLGLTVDDVWDSNNASLWNATLFPIAQTPEESTELTLQLLYIVESLRNGKSVEKNYDWSKIPRISLNSAIESKNMHGQSYFFRNKHVQDISFYSVRNMLLKEVDTTTWLQKLPFIVSVLHPLIQSYDDYSQLHFGSHLDSLLKQCEDDLISDPLTLEKSRSIFSLSVLVGEISASFDGSHSLNSFYKDLSIRLNKKSYSILRDILITPFTPRNGILPFLLTASPPSVGKTNQVKLPARIILAGGWSDTPPFCLERGGDIVNVAIEINQKRPITVTASAIQESFIRIQSKDSNSEFSIPLTDLKSLLTYNNPNEPLALHKACISFLLFPHYCLEKSLEGITNETLRAEFQKILGENGLSLVTDVDIPKGSGLGTSSILMLACVRALRGLFVERKEEDNLLEYNAVLAIEQMLTTGGGWQDQIGGGEVGLKFITAAPGPSPDYKISQIQLSSKHQELFNSRLLVVYTGKTRLASQVLWNIVDNWFMRREVTVIAMEKIKAKASEMAKIFQQFAEDQVLVDQGEKHFVQLGKELNDVRRVNIELERSMSNEYLDSLFDALDKFVTGSHIIGAGSGGYILGWLKKDCTKDDVRKALKESHPNAEVTEMTIAY